MFWPKVLAGSFDTILAESFDRLLAFAFSLDTRVPI